MLIYSKVIIWLIARPFLIQGKLIHLIDSDRIKAEEGAVPFLDRPDFADCKLMLSWIPGLYWYL